MADSDTISGIENLKSAVSGETPAYQYKDPNTDMMKAISKCIDAATGETGTEYAYKNPNTDVIQKMDELAGAIAESGGSGGGSFITLPIHVGYKLKIKDGTITEDTNYFYTDPISVDGILDYVVLDLGFNNKTDDTTGVELLDSSFQHANYLNANERYRRYKSTASSYINCSYIRISSKVNYMNDVFFRDETSGLLIISSNKIGPIYSVNDT